MATVEQLNEDASNKIKDLRTRHDEFNGVLIPPVTSGTAKLPVEFDWADCQTDLENMQDVEMAWRAIHSTLMDAERIDDAGCFLREADRVEELRKVIPE